MVFQNYFFISCGIVVGKRWFQAAVNVTDKCSFHCIIYRQLEGYKMEAVSGEPFGTRIKCLLSCTEDWNLNWFISFSHAYSLRKKFMS